MSLETPPVERDSTAKTNTHLNQECWSKPAGAPGDNAGKAAAPEAGTSKSDLAPTAARPDAAQAKGAESTVIASAGPQLSADGKQILPGLTIDKDTTQKLESRVMNSSASAQERLQAVKSLVDQGVSSFEIKDDNGHSAKVRMESEKAGDKNLVHLFLDGEGREKVGLRGVADSGGNMQQQRDKNGKQVSWGGSGMDQLNGMHAAEGEKQPSDVVDPKAPERTKVAAADATPIDPRTLVRSDTTPAVVKQESPPAVKADTPPAIKSTAPPAVLAPESPSKQFPAEIPADKNNALPQRPDMQLPVTEANKGGKADVQRPEPMGAPLAPERPAETDDLRLRNNSGHKDSYPDAVVRVPENFDPSKPIHLEIYNHGFETTAGKDFDKFNMDQALKNAPPNTVLIVPEWQKSPDSRDSRQGGLAGQGKYDAMVQEVFNKTPALAGKTLKDVDSVSIQSHSGGFSATLSQLNDNKLSDKVKSLTLLDSNYSKAGFNDWVERNIGDLAAGTKQYNNIYTSHSKTMARNREQEQFISQLLKKNHLPSTQLLDSNNDGLHTLSANDFASHSIVFKYSDISSANMRQHWQVPNLYLPIINQANRQR